MFGIKRTDSKVVEGIPNPDLLNQSSDNLNTSNLSHNRVPQLNVSREDPYKDDHPTDQLEKHSQKMIQTQLKVSKISTSLKRSKIPNFLKQTLRKRAQQSVTFKAKKSTQNVSDLTKSIFSKIKKEQITCGICIGVIDQKDIVKLCQCHHTYCKSCIRDYVTYKIKTFEEVFCPQEECNSIMSQNTEFYQNLPQQIKKQYIKAHNFYVTSNDPSLKLCPKQDCEGIIKIKENQPWICGKCSRQFCVLCNFEKHEGSCDQKEIDFFHNNLHYRQCQNCKAVIEKTQGCNHMTCKCKYEFCYLCGQIWKGYDHVCNQTIAQIRARNGGMFGNGGACQCCGCEQTCGETCGCLLLIPMRLLMGLLIGVFLLIEMARQIIMITGYFVLSLLAGMFGYSIDFICSYCSEGCCVVVIFIIFPVIPIGVGIYRAMREMFCQLVGEAVEYYCDLSQRACRSLWA